MNMFPRAVIVLVLGWLEYVLLLEARANVHSEEVDQSKTVLLFVSIILIGLVIGIIVAFSILPVIGEAFAGLFYGSNARIEKNPHAAAVSKSAQGDFEGAIQEYQRVFDSDPSDLMALSEIVRICCDQLHDYARAAKVLEQALENEHPAESVAFLSNRLVDVYWTCQHDQFRARQVLMRIVNAMPETKHAANARHRLQELERGGD